MAEVQEIDVQTAHDWAAAGDAVLLDVREAPELADAAIAGAVHNPMSSFDFENVPGGDGKKLVVFCAHGMRCIRSQITCCAKVKSTWPIPWPAASPTGPVPDCLWSSWGVQLPWKLVALSGTQKRRAN